MVDGERVIANPFYLTIPGGENGGLWWVTWVFGVFATLIASQGQSHAQAPTSVGRSAAAELIANLLPVLRESAMITATFSLIQQLMGQRCFPAIRINYTSNITGGQVYIPAINWIRKSD